MLLSSIISKYGLGFGEISKDVEFETLSLAGAKLELGALTFVEERLVYEYSMIPYLDVKKFSN